MNELEEGSQLKLDFSKIWKIAQNCKDVIPVAVQNADTKEVILVAYTNELAMKESFEKKKLILWSTSRNKHWFKGETSGETFDLLEARVNCEQNSLLYIVRPCRGGMLWASRHRQDELQGAAVPLPHVRPRHRARGLAFLESARKQRRRPLRSTTWRPRHFRIARIPPA